MKIYFFHRRHYLNVYAKEITIYFGILLLFGKPKQAFDIIYWEIKAGTFNILVSNSISRLNKTVYRYLHYNDNISILPNNKTYKIQSLLEQIDNYPMI